jgi:hypothetical protein
MVTGGGISGRRQGNANRRILIRRDNTMPVEPPRKITETQIIRREEETTLERRKKQLIKKEKKKEPEKSGKVDIRI